MLRVMRWLMLVSLCCGVSANAAAQGADAALVQQLNGEATYAGSAGAGKVAAFMKVHVGDSIRLAPGARLSLLYFAGGRQEAWQGPARIDVGASESRTEAGKPQSVSQLPAAVAQTIMKIPDTIKIAKLGGVQVRGVKAEPRPSPEQEAELSAARSVYAQLRAQMPRDDIAPELYLFAVLQAQLRYEDMQQLIASMRAAQPDSDDVRRLSDWLAQHRAP